MALLLLPPLESLRFFEATGKTEAAGLRQAIADADWDTVERHGGLDAVVDKIDQVEEETAAKAGAGWIDDFRLWGSRRCRRINAPLKKTWWRTQVVHVFDNHNAALSEGAALPAVVGALPGNPHWTWVGTAPRRPLR